MHFSICILQRFACLPGQSAASSTSMMKAPVTNGQRDVPCTCSGGPGGIVVLPQMHGTCHSCRGFALSIHSPVQSRPRNSDAKHEMKHELRMDERKMMPSWSSKEVTQRGLASASSHGAALGYYYLPRFVTGSILAASLSLSLLVTSTEHQQRHRSGLTGGSGSDSRNVVITPVWMPIFCSLRCPLGSPFSILDTFTWPCSQCYPHRWIKAALGA